MKEEVLIRTEEFVDRLQAFANAHRRKYFPNLSLTKYSAVPGRKYIKIVVEDGQTSVHSFIDAETGDILKAASWKSPAKHARGNIFADDYGVGTAVDVFGAKYLK